MRLLLISLLALSAGTPAGAQTPAEPTPCVEVGGIAHRWIPNVGELGDVSFQIQVTNTCDRPQHVNLHVEMLDADGFLIDNAGWPVTVRPGTDTVRVKHSMQKSHADRVAHYEVTVEPSES